LEILDVSQCNLTTITEANRLYGVSEVSIIVNKHPHVGGRYRRKTRKRSKRIGKKLTKKHLKKYKNANYS
jgi:hypothetical protein